MMDAINSLMLDLVFYMQNKCITESDHICVNQICDITKCHKITLKVGHELKTVVWESRA